MPGKEVMKMGVFVRTSKNSGVSVPWLVAPFLFMGVVIYWTIWLTVMSFVWGVRFSVLTVRWAHALLRSRRDTERPTR